MTEQPSEAEDTATCYRHPEREAHIRCTRCNRRICPDCMVAASVGFQCPECVRQGNKGVRRGRTVFGGAVTGDPGYVTKVLIAVNALMWLVQIGAGSSFERRLWLIGGPVFDPVLMEQVGVADGESYRLLTAAFLHGGLLHLALNMYALYLFGPPLEGALGRVRFIALYFISALGGSAVSYAFSNPAQPSVGASGAIFGLLGAFLVVSRRMGRDTTGVLILLAINFVYGLLVPRIDWHAHLGGLITGVLTAVAFAYAPKVGRTAVQTGGVLGVLAAVVVVVVWRTAALT
ncbi:MAG TPA: rhomboid family intramembrane serine protease [Actinomycetes bacterium]